MKRTAVVLAPLTLALTLAGCGGGGGSREVNLRAGGYAGTYAFAPQAPLPETEPLRTAKSGAATATVAGDGTFEIRAGERIRFYGKAGKDGKAAYAWCAVLADALDGTPGISFPQYSSTVAFSPRGNGYAVRATAHVATSAPTGDAVSDVEFAIPIERAAGPVTQE